MQSSQETRDERIPERHSRPRVSKKARLGGAALAVATLALAACSSSSSSSSSSPAASSAATSSAGTASSSAAATPASGVSAAVTATVNQYTQTPVLSLQPLPKKPPMGDKLIYLAEPTPSALVDAQGAKAAAAAVGWSATVIDYQGTPQSLDTAFEQAIAAKPTVIALDSTPTSEFQQQLTQADKAGIIVDDANQVTPPTGAAANGLDAVPFDKHTSEVEGQISADWIIQNSNANADVAIVNITGYPGPIVESDAFTQELTSQCPKCKVTDVNVQIADIGTTAPSKEVAAIEANPSINYVWFTFGDLALGFDSALHAAGIQNRVKVTSASADDETMAAVRSGTEAMTVDNSYLVNGWNIFDAALRYLETGKPVETGYTPFQIYTKSNVPSSNEPIVPANYVQLFSSAWHVSS
jgi:ribose transport system substrate-binding protein